MLANGIWDIEEACALHVPAPELPTVLAHLFAPDKPILDLGCGTGYYVWILNIWHKREVYGVEGTPDINRVSYYKNIQEADLSAPLKLDSPQGHVLSIEVGEHIPPQFERVVLDNLTSKCNGTLVLSWAVPGQGGHGHVNERGNDYIIGEVRKRGLVFDVDSTMFARGMPYLHTPWLTHSLMVFQRGN